MQTMCNLRRVVLLIPLLVPLGCFAQDQEPKCEGALTEAKTLKLLEEGVTERRTIALLVACGMDFELTPEARAKFQELGLSEEAFKALEWLEKWESLGVTIGSANSNVPKLSLTGAWTATFSDSKFNGTLHVNLAQSEDNTIRGTYSSSLGGGGTVLGTALVKEAKLEIRQSIEGCPGVTKAILRKVGESLTGEYVGFDCAGPHLNGRFTLSPGVSLASDEEPTFVRGSVLELRLVRTVNVATEPEHTEEKLAIESVLRRKGIPLSDDWVKADVVLRYGLGEGKPFLAAFRWIHLHNTLRAVWACPTDAERPDSAQVAAYCAERFASAYAEAQGN